jgi:hypothetical protein
VIDLAPSRPCLCYPCFQFEQEEWQTHYWNTILQVKLDIRVMVDQLDESLALMFANYQAKETYYDRLIYTGLAHIAYLGLVLCDKKSKDSLF